MNGINQLTVTFSRSFAGADGKVKNFSRRFANINPQATTEQIKAFKVALENMLGEQFTTIELNKSEIVH
ncbi:hypothetical protein [Staphylococcus arlettae]|uniref:sigS mRNA-stabilizing protein SroA n=1 Tax=Staphylococcus arlettae TaxID=29378 RepID=UPI001E61BB7E|nr:hypothetical protein [Staphylococcus arlettae]MCD8863554.1 hypothetical protein [Staphylococcus arlettae]